MLLHGSLRGANDAANNRPKGSNNAFRRCIYFNNRSVDRLSATLRARPSIPANVKPLEISAIRYESKRLSRKRVQREQCAILSATEIAGLAFVSSASPAERVFCCIGNGNLYESFFFQTRISRKSDRQMLLTFLEFWGNRGRSWQIEKARKERKQSIMYRANIHLEN